MDFPESDAPTIAYLQRDILEDWNFRSFRVSGDQRACGSVRLMGVGDQPHETVEVAGPCTREPR